MDIVAVASLCEDQIFWWEDGVPLLQSHGMKQSTYGGF